MNTFNQTSTQLGKTIRKKLTVKRLVLGLLVILLALELILRFLVGLGNPPLYEKNETYGYRLKPHQNIFRFFNRLSTNSFGMRSEEPNPKKKKILKIGDSITNGGMLISQSELASSILEQQINAQDNGSQVLNISAGGWNVANQLEFLKTYGLFSSKLAIIEWNGGELAGTLIPQTLNGGEFAITSPEEAPLFAIQELFQRYIIPQFISDYYTVPFGQFKETVSGAGMNPCIPQMLEWLKSEDIQIIIYLHPKLAEVEKKQFDANTMALQTYLTSQNISIISGIPYMRQSFYRDDVHLNAKGHQAMANAIFQYLEMHKIGW